MLPPLLPGEAPSACHSMKVPSITMLLSEFQKPGIGHIYRDLFPNEVTLICFGNLARMSSWGALL